MTPADVVEKVTSWARLERAEVGLWYEAHGHWSHPGGRLTSLYIIGPDWQVMELPPSKITLADLGRVLDALGACALWSPDALETSIWVLAKLKRLFAFTGCTRTFSHLLQQPAPPFRWRTTVVDDYQARKLELLTAHQQSIIGLEMGVIRAMARSTVEGLAAKDGTTIHPEWTLVHPSGNPMPLAHHPPINSWTKPQKATLVAPPGFRWMQIRYPLLEARVLAAMTGDRPAFDFLSDPATIDEESERGVVAFMRKGVTASEEEITNWGPYGVRLLPLRTYLRDVVLVKTLATKELYSFMHRRWRWQGGQMTEHEERRVATAFAGHSAATALKIALVKLMHLAEAQPLRMFLGFCQMVPHFDSVNYLIDERVPHDRHCESLLSLMQMQLAIRDDLWVLHPVISVGPTLTELVAWNDPQALTKIALARDGAEQLTCVECGLTTMSQRVMDTHMLEDHGVGAI